MAWASLAFLVVPSALPRQSRVLRALRLELQSTGSRLRRPVGPDGCSLCSHRPRLRSDSRLAIATRHAGGQEGRLSGLAQPPELGHSRRDVECCLDWETARRGGLHRCLDPPGGPQSRLCRHAYTWSRRPKLIGGAGLLLPLDAPPQSEIACSNQDTHFR